MEKRKIKDALDLDTGEKIYFRSHAEATYMSDGRTVEQAVKQGGGGSSGSYDDTEIRNEIAELSSEKEDKANKVTSLTDESTDEQYPSAKAVYALKERISENEVLIEDLQNTKIEKENDDYYPKMAVGTADNLAGVDEVDSEFNFRQSGGGAITDGVARVQSIKGNSVVWNQLIQENSFAVGEKKGVTFTIEGNAIVLNGTAEADFDYQMLAAKKVTISENHKYAVLGGEAGKATLNFYDSALIGGPGRANTIFSAVGTGQPTQRIYCNSGQTFTNYKIYPRLIDLTKMFQAGNEPTTIEEFYQRIPMGVDLNAYNEGEIIDMKATGIISKGVNAWDEEWEIGLIDYNTGAKKDGTDNIRSVNYTRVLPSTAYVITAPEKLTMCFYDKDKKFISYVGGQSSFTTPTNAYYILFYAYGNYGKTYKNDICINISNADINGKYFPYEEASEDLSIVAKYFPNGMRSAGSAHDEIRYNKATNKWEAVKRIGAVNLGDLKWTYQSASQRFYSEHIADIKFDSSTSSVKSKNARYQDVSWGNFSTNDKVVSIFTQEERNKRIYIKDSAYTDVATLKAALQGVILYYELAEPIVTEIEEKNFNLDYKVWNNGTEQAIAEGKSSALSADITYGFNAIRKIKDNTTAIENLNKNVINKQDKLVSGTSIKTINGNSLLGSGNVNVSYNDTAIKNQIAEKQDKLIEGDGIRIDGNTISCIHDKTLYKVVSELPEVGEEHKIYLVVSTEQEEQNLYNEYAYVNGAWEMLGTYKATIDLEPYVKKEELATINNLSLSDGGNIEILGMYDYYKKIGGGANEKVFNTMMKYLFTPFMISSSGTTNIPDDLLNDAQTNFFTDYYWHYTRLTGGEPFKTTEWKNNVPYKFMGMLTGKYYIIDFTTKTIKPA